MLKSRKLYRGTALVLCGLALGAAGGYAASASGAGGPSSAGAERPTHRQALAGRLRRAVSLTAVVPTKDGGFATISMQRGIVAALSGTQLTLHEGSAHGAYRSVTITLPGNVIVRVARKAAALNTVVPGDRATVLEGPRRTALIVRAPRQPKSARTGEAAAG